MMARLIPDYRRLSRIISHSRVALITYVSNSKGISSVDNREDLMMPMKGSKGKIKGRCHDERIQMITAEVSEERRKASFSELMMEFNIFLDSGGSNEGQERLDMYFQRENPHHFLQYMNAGTEGLFNVMLACTGLYARRQFLRLSICDKSVAKLSDPLYLPSRDEVNEIFQLHLSSSTIKASTFVSEFKTDDWDTHFKVESFLDHVLVCSILRDGGFKRYSLPTALGHFVYCRRGFTEIYTKEFVDSLAIELAKMQRQSTQNYQRPILEIGAGDGALAYHLNKTGKLSPSYIHATDSNPAKIEDVDPMQSFFTQYTPLATEHILNNPEFCDEPLTTGPACFPVESLDYETAIARYKPDIVLCSYMPKGVDWFNFPAEDPVRQLHVGDYGRSGEFYKYSNLTDIRLQLSDEQISSCDYSKVAGWSSTIVVDKDEGY